MQVGTSRRWSTVAITFLQVESLHWLESESAKAYKIQTQKLGGASDCKAEGKVLNRILRYTMDS